MKLYLWCIISVWTYISSADVIMQDLSASQHAAEDSKRYLH